ncbi:GTP-binding protein [Citrus sinensis]|uniref:GTP-binding protein n=2 Tax=Citrus sinensis TaxID=2711 RepID=A0ACB8J432_CITSI|nr:GTP-binding protein [Citrus sinensis]
MLRAISVVKRTQLRSITQTLTFPISLHSYSYSSSKRQTKDNKDKDDLHDVVTLFNRDPDDPPRLFLVQPRLKPPTFLQAKLNEALCLANSLEEQRDGYFDTDFFDKELPPHVVVQNPSLKSGKARADTFFGPGTVETIKCHINGAESKARSFFIFMFQKWANWMPFLSMLFFLEFSKGIWRQRAWGKPVLDRVGLIIEIFNAHAHTKEAKLQAELAALMYKKSRLVRVRGPDGRLTFGETGEAEVVSARGRGSGGRGFISGAGETELQLQRRRILERRSHLLSQIEEVRRTRAVQRAARRRHGGSDGRGLATVAVVGYTNAGKSTLVSALSDSDLFSDARLFATLDPRLKSVVLPSGRKVLLSDTVGFISDLPLQLVDAFHATLEEVVEADLLVHVLDCTAPNLEEHRTTVLQVLQQVGVSEEKLKNMIEVWNKIDYHDEEMGDVEYIDGDDISSFSRAEDKDTTSEPVDVECIDNYGGDDADNNDGFVSEDLGESMNKNHNDYSDGWLLSGDEQDNVEEEFWNAAEDQQPESTKDVCVMEKDSQSQDQHAPDVKISARTGVGLQELLEIIDERLKTLDDKQKSPNVVERDFFNKKWRPPRTEDSSVAVE